MTTMRRGPGIWVVLLAIAWVTGCEEGPTTLPETDVTRTQDGLNDTAAPPEDGVRIVPSDSADDPGDSDIWQGLLELPEPDGTTPPDGPLDESSPLDQAQSDLGEVHWLDAQPGTCQGNGNGVLEADELPSQAAMGLVSTFTVNQPGSLVEVPDLAGDYSADLDGYQWDFSAPQAADTVHHESILPLANYWFADHYPDGEFVQPFSADYFGVYSQDQTGLHLWGIASVEEGDKSTALQYAEPVTLLPFPLAKGDSWNHDEVPAHGLFEGETYPVDYGLAGTLSITHTYTFLADKAGEVTVPLGTFPVIRVYADVEMNVWNSQMMVPVAGQRLKLVYFVAECVGTVALIRSQDGELAKEFSQATEYKRLGIAK